MCVHCGHLLGRRAPAADLPGPEPRRSAGARAPSSCRPAAPPGGERPNYAVRTHSRTVWLVCVSGVAESGGGGGLRGLKR